VDRDQSRGLRAKRKNVEWADVLVPIKQAKVRKRAEGEIEDVMHRKKDEKTKQSKKRSEDNEDKDHSSCSSSEDHRKGYPKRRL
jgi:hypothetical protein